MSTCRDCGEQNDDNRMYLVPQDEEVPWARKTVCRVCSGKYGDAINVGDFAQASHQRFLEAAEEEGRTGDYMAFLLEDDLIEAAEGGSA